MIPLWNVFHGSYKTYVMFWTGISRWEENNITFLHFSLAVSFSLHTDPAWFPCDYAAAKDGCYCCSFANAWGGAHSLVSICPRPSTHQHTQACRRGTHAQSNDLSRDSTQSCWMTGDSRARTNSPKIESLLASEWKAFHPHYPPKSSQVTLNRHKKIWAFDESVSFFFCSLIRGLFASHYTETHYQEDGSAVTNAHNFTVRWLLSDCDIYSQVDVWWYTAANTVKTDPLKMGT